MFGFSQRLKQFCNCDFVVNRSKGRLPYQDTEQIAGVVVVSLLLNYDFLKPLKCLSPTALCMGSGCNPLRAPLRGDLFGDVWSFGVGSDFIAL